MNAAAALATLAAADVRLLALYDANADEATFAEARDIKTAAAAALDALMGEDAALLAQADALFDSASLESRSARP